MSVLEAASLGPPPSLQSAACFDAALPALDGVQLGSFLLPRGSSWLGPSLSASEVAALGSSLPLRGIA